MSTSVGIPRSLRPSVARELLVFFSAAVTVSWVLGGVGIVFLGDLGLALGVLSLPVVAGFLTWRQAGTLRPLWAQVTRWRVGWHWFGVAVALPVAIIATALAGLNVLTGEGPAEERITGPTIVILFVLYVLVVGGPEEPAWRGYALPRLQNLFDATTASLVLGAIWALWHLPLWFLPGAPQNGSPFVLFALMSLGLCVIYTWLYNSTHGSVLIVMVFHAMWNLALSWAPTSAASWSLLAGLTTVIAVVLVLALGREHLSTSHRIQQPNAGSSAT